MDLRARIAHRHWTLIAALAAATVLVSRPAAAQSEADRAPPVVEPSGWLPTPEQLEAEGAVIGEIRIVIGDVFDTRLKGERSWLYRTANKLHIETREATVRDQLLFKPGEPYRVRLIEEAERG